jgi:peptidoglycan hydrolase-like protein with peptidoglycan-binding domain
VPSEGDAVPPARGRKRVLAGVALLVVAGVVVVAIVATRGAGHKRAGSPRIGAGAATVQRRNLVTSEDESGTISYANSSTVANRLQGTLTWVPAVGRVIDPGQRLFDVNNFPVILMDGTTPAYRTLDSSDSAGPDVQQLNANLIDLGFNADGIVDDDEWQPATTAGVEDLQEANGEPETASLRLGTIVFLRGAQRVAGLEGGATTASDDIGADHDEFVDATVTMTTSGPSRTPATVTTETTSTTPAPTAPHESDGALTRAVSRLSTKVQQLQRQDQRLQHKLSTAKSHKPSGSSSGGGDSGPVSGGDSPVMTTTSTNLVVSVSVPAGEQGVTRVGARVPVVMPSGSTAHGHVVTIGQATSTGGNSTVAITIHLDKHENGRNLNQATVSVTFIEKTARHVLSVPVTALLAQPGGRYAVQEATAPDTLIDVSLGTFATGYVQVSGRGLHPGLKITDSQG